MDRELNQINVIPLVDVMLVLLVIVLTTATFITTGHIPVDLAQAKGAGDPQEALLVITLTAEGKLYLNDQPIADGALRVAMNPKSRTSPVVIRADRIVRLDQFVTIVDKVRSMGFQQVSLEVTRT